MIKQTILVAILFMGLGGVFLAPAVNAAECGGVKTSVIDCDKNVVGTCSVGGPPVNAKCPDPTAIYTAPDVQNTGIWGLLMVILNIMTAGVAVVGVGGVVYGSVLYTAAGGNAEQVKKGRDIIRNTIFGLVMYALMFAFMNYLIPGGVFS